VRSPSERGGLALWTGVGLAYLAAFAVLTWPAVAVFGDAFLTDAGDGMTNVWNLWWIHEALCVLHQTPFHTPYLFFPSGTTLVGHTLNPLNGLMTAPVFDLLPREVTHNAVVVLTFVVGGLTAFLLCRHVTGSVAGAFCGGFVYTFSSFHFAHAEGHMQMISLEWIPFFLWAWLRWLETPGPGRAALAAVGYVLVLLCDLYFTLFSTLAAAVLAVWWLARGGAPPLRRYAPGAVLFAVLGGVPAAAWAAALLSTQTHDPFVGAHDPASNGMDLLAPFVYGGHWRFARLTEPVWRRWPGNIHESSLHLGWTVLAAIAYAARHRRRLDRPGFGVWTAIALGFAAVALGPTLHVVGRPFAAVPMPYTLLALVFPPIELAGVPARFFVMTTLACAVLVAFAVPLLRAALPRAVLAAAVVGLAVETWPRPLPVTRLPVPGWVEALRAAPAGAAVDLVSTQGGMVYYQTVHEKPLAYGYIARYPRSVIVRAVEANVRARAVATRGDAGAADALARDGVRWIVAAGPPVAGPAVRWSGDGAVLYELPAGARDGGARPRDGGARPRDGGARPRDGGKR
jgi:hypothetical protein